MNKFKFGPCGNKTQDKIIVCKEKGKKFTGENINRKLILKVEVDGCLIKKEAKCDWLIIDTDGNIAHFIELKGKDIKHAIEQLSNTIKIVSNPENSYIGKKFDSKRAYVVISHFPKKGPALDNMKKELRKKYNTALVVKEYEIKQKL
jgi:hypothetical protein